MKPAVFAVALLVAVLGAPAHADELDAAKAFLSSRPELASVASKVVTKVGSGAYRLEATSGPAKVFIVKAGSGWAAALTFDTSKLALGALVPASALGDAKISKSFLVVGAAAGSFEAAADKYQMNWDTDGPETSSMQANKSYQLQILVAHQADAVEAILGAIFLDAGIEACKERILSWYGSRLTSIQPGVQKDSKTQLQEYLQGRRLPLPLYEVIDTQGDDHDQIFTVRCTVQGRAPVVASGNSRRKAEQDSARILLEQVKNDL